jgi:Kdo2-lipid IVA lauroyltransferase/acyltransferase
MSPLKDLRTGAAWTPLQRVKNDALWALATILLAMTSPLPVAVLRALGRAIGVGAHALGGEARRTALANVARVLPTLAPRDRRALVRRCFLTMGELLGETVALLRPRDAPPPLELAPEARTLLEQARLEGRGVLLASAHLGPWERVAASIVAAGMPFVTMARESYDPRFSRLYEKLRGGQGVRLVWRGSAAAPARILRTLRGGGILGVPMDLRSRVASCDAPFLGHPAPTAIGPARIALRAGAAVVVATAAPGAPAGSMVVTATRIPTGDLPREPRGAAQGAAAARDLTARINEELSRRILALPHAWVWMHDRWTGKE